MNFKHKTDRARLRSEDLRQEAQGLGNNAESMNVQINSLKLDLEKFEFDLEQKVRLVSDIKEELEQHNYVSREGVICIFNKLYLLFTVLETN